MSTAAFSAVPGSMEPGAIWPGDAALAFPDPAVVFTIGTPFFEWEYGTPCFDWAAGDPYLS